MGMKPGGEDWKGYNAKNQPPTKAPAPAPTRPVKEWTGPKDPFYGNLT